MGEKSIHIRPARQNDAALVAPLILQAIGDIAYRLTGADTMQQVLDALAHFFTIEQNRLSYQNVLVAEFDQQLAGIVISYHGRDAPKLDCMLLEHVRRLKQDSSIMFDQEADEDEWYIDTLSVAPQFAGRGIATTLIHAVESLCRQIDQHKLALAVDEENTRAYRLYQHLGFQRDKVINLYQHPHQHMVKYLPT